MNEVEKFDHMKEIEKLVSALYKEWVKTHDPFSDSFEDLLYELLPEYTFSYSEHGSEWICVGKY